MDQSDSICYYNYAIIIIFFVWLTCMDGFLLTLSTLAEFVSYIILCNCLELLFRYSLLGDYNWNIMARVWFTYKYSFFLLIGASFILALRKQALSARLFGKLMIVCSILNILQMVNVTQMSSVISHQGNIGYGEGMACNFFEGYLSIILPNDGQNDGLKGLIENYEATQGIEVPIKRLFLIMTKSLYAPPNLTDFNRSRNKNYLEAATTLNSKKLDVAGVKKREYKNSVYKIHQTDGSGVVYLVAECATPLLTLHKVKQKRGLYSVLANADFDEITFQFHKTLKHLLDESPECKERCELVYFDDTNKELNLADVLLEHVTQLLKDM